MLVHLGRLLVIQKVAIINNHHFVHDSYQIAPKVIIQECHANRLGHNEVTVILGRVLLLHKRNEGLQVQHPVYDELSLGGGLRDILFFFNFYLENIHYVAKAVDVFEGV